ncbi:oligosaccharide flippase family protein [Halegenticoccus soli]|uniref:oligosaccharide flippase family protein n=1 Tax=Halegenticoccus soli TaxID=1985678 RepID=UPI000C6E83C3|nr:oligosaccharide flippase family protein [Halegenticoccus soli]
MRRNIVTAFASIAGSRMLDALVSALITPLLFRILGKGEYGQYAAVIAVFNLLMILVSSGINSGVRKYISEERAESDWKDYVFAYYFRLALALSLVAAVALAVGAYTGIMGQLMKPDYTVYFYLLAVLVLAAQFREYSRRALMGLKLEHIGEPLNVVHRIAFGVTAVGLAALGYGVAGVLVGYIFASTLVFIISLTFVTRYISLTHLFQPLPEDFPKKELFSFNHTSIVYIFLLTSMYHVDVIFLDTLVGNEQAGVYKAALVLVEFLWFVPRSVQSVMIQSTSNLWVQGRTDRIQRIASRSTRYALLLTTLMGLGLGALASDFVPFYYGDGASEMVLPLILLLPGVIGFAIARPLLSINHAKGDMKILILATGAAAAINVTLNLLLIPRYGMIGAAIATSTGYGSLPFFQAWVGHRLGYDPFADVRLGRIALTTIGAGVPIIGLPLLIDNSLLSLVIVPPVGFVIYSALAVATGAISFDEVFDIFGALPEPISSKAAALRVRVGSSGE